MFYGETRWMKDTVTPGFRSQQKLGKVFFGKLYKNVVETRVIAGGTGYYYADSGGNGISHEGPDAGSAILRILAGPSPGALDAIDSDDISRLMVEVSTGVYNQRGRSSSNLWETLAELDKTIDTIRHPLGAFSRFIGGKGPIAKLKEVPGAAANAWLQWQYGVKPVISDIDNIIKGLKKPTGKIRVTSRDKGSITQFRIANSTYHDAVFNIPLTAYCSDTIKVRGMSLDESVVDLANNIGFSSKGLITLPWELVRFSFVVDWFISLGDYIGALVPAYGLNSLGSCLTSERTRSTTYRMDGASLNNGAILHLGPSCEYIVTNIEKVRTDLLAPGVVIKHDFKFQSIPRVLSAISLIVQQLTGGRFSRFHR
jgi:hypothetical protein